MNGMKAQPDVPSNVCTPVLPSTVTSLRIRPPRLISRTRGACIPGPMETVPVMRSDCTALTFSSPPRAATFFAMTSSAVCAASGRANAVAARKQGTSRRMEDS